MTEDGGRVIPGRDPGLGLFPEVLVLEARGIHFLCLVEHREALTNVRPHVIPGRRDPGIQNNMLSGSFNARVWQDTSPRSFIPPDFPASTDKCGACGYTRTPVLI